MAPRNYGQRAVFASLRALFHLHIVIISAKEVVISLALASLLVSRIVGKLFDRLSQNSAGKVAREPCKKPLDFDGNRDHVTLGISVWD